MPVDNDQSSSNKDTAPAPQSVELPVIDLLEYIGRGDSIENAAQTANVSVDDARASFRQAARTIRSLAAPKTPAPAPEPPKQKSADWQDLTVAEALGILAEHAADGSKPKAGEA